jgi:N-acetylglucosaminyldiphosphoundecaprenol N-acetyl-beta-D-mannosaminyltransferase
MRDVLLRIRDAAQGTTPFLISTPNLNFLVNSLSDTSFRESLLRSDLCLSDGMPIVWIARLMGVPIKNRVAGSDVFDALVDQSRARPLKVFLFGGAAGVAVAASRALNARSSGVHCVGLLYPGFGTVEEMSHDDIIETLNSSGAELLVVSLGATKGQSWLLHNHDRLKIPVRVHLGADIHLEARIHLGAALCSRVR